MRTFLDDPENYRMLISLREYGKSIFLVTQQLLVTASGVLKMSSLNGFFCFDVFLTVHHSIDLFHLPTLMHNSFIH
jgi:hypothetical protein